MQNSSKMELVSWFLVVLALLSWIYWLWTRRNLYKFAMSFPGPWGFPIVGSLLNVKHMNNVLNFLEETFRKCGAYTVFIWLGTYPILVTADPDLIKKINSSPEMLNKGNLVYKVLDEVVNGGIITSRVDIWNKKRKVINPAFSHKVLVSFLPIFHKTSQDTVNILLQLANDGGAHDLLTVCQKMTALNSFETTMGHMHTNGEYSLDKLDKSFHYIMRVMSSLGILGAVHMDWIIKFHYKFQKCHKYLADYVWKVIESKLKSGTGQNQTKNTESDDLKKPALIFIEQAIEAYNKKQFTMNDIISESRTIVAAAAETTGLTLYSTIVLLAMHPVVQQRLYEEIIGFYPKGELQVNYEDFDHLPYLGLVIDEVLRLIPPVPLIGRHVVKDTQLENDLILPKGLEVVIPIYNLHRRKDIWGENADKFDPERFLPTNITNLQSLAFMPFSKGVRNCVGWRYAYFALKVTLCHFVSNFRFETDMKIEDLRFGGNISIKYLGEPKIRIYKRNPSL